MRTEDMVPILEDLDKVGYFSLEMWGGATFDVCIRYLNEDPWERIRIIKSHVRSTPLQMLLRGQNVVGYTNYADDIVYAFVDKAAECGIDIFRIFDALNDVRNMEASMKAVKKTGAHAQASVVYTLSPVHTFELYLETALKLQDMGADSICIKDMAGLISPYDSYDLVSLFKSKLDVPVHLHTHYVGGMAIGACLKAVEAGVDIFDACSGPLAFGSSQPPVETLVRALQDTPYDTGLDLHHLFEIANYWEDLRRRRGFERGVTRINAMKVFDHQVPGGMITNLVSQLEEQKALHRMDEVLKEIALVRAELGYPPLVTPTSQIVGGQAVANVLLGERYKMVPNEVKQYVRGYYGKPPAPIDREIQRMIIGDEQPIICRPADLLENKFERTKEEIGDLAESEEDYITYALFPAWARKFFVYRKNLRDGEAGAVQTSAAACPQTGPAEVGPNSAERPAMALAHTERTLPAARRSVRMTKTALQADDTRAAIRMLERVSGRRLVPTEGEEMNLEDVKELIRLVSQSDVNELRIETTGMRVKISKGADDDGSPSRNMSKSNQATAVGEIADESAANLVEVVAPMVGTFYNAAAPGTAPFVEVGSRVEKAQTLCIIEAMKLMNEIEAKGPGKIVEVLVENAQPIEYGQVLFLIEPEN
jgi:oxaloacetate decarboxylase alpha subunit